MPSFFLKVLFSSFFVFNYSIYAKNDTFYITKKCDIERKKFRKNYYDYIYLVEKEQYISAKRKFLELDIRHSFVNIECPYDITKYTNILFSKMKSINDSSFMQSQWTDKPITKTFKKKSTRIKKTSIYQEEQRSDVIYTESEYKKMLEKKYKGTPTLYIRDIIVYDVQKISYFRENKNKIMIVGKEKSYVFPRFVLKTAKFKNATTELRMQFNNLLKDN